MTGFTRRISPDLTVELDSSNCIVMRTPERTITVTNVAALKSALDLAKTYQQIAEDESWAGKGFTTRNEESAT